MSSYLHPFDEGMIDISRRTKSSLSRHIKFEISLKMSNHHLKRKIPIRDQKVLREHTINDKIGDIDSNAF